MSTRSKQSGSDELDLERARAEAAAEDASRAERELLAAQAEVAPARSQARDDRTAARDDPAATRRPRRGRGARAASVPAREHSPEPSGGAGDGPIQRRTGPAS